MSDCRRCAGLGHTDADGERRCQACGGSGWEDDTDHDEVRAIYLSRFPAARARMESENATAGRTAMTLSDGAQFEAAIPLTNTTTSRES